MEQRPPEFGGIIKDISGVAKALGIKPSDIDIKLPIQQVSCGAPFLLVPLITRAAVDNASLDRAAIATLLDRAGLTKRGVFVFSLEPGDDDATAYSRMFGFGVVEDPATGNASGPLGSYLTHYKLVTPEQAKHMVSSQGVKMGRPSKIHIAVDVSDEKISKVRIGGTAVQISQSTISIAE
jgi:trans-2,3-dihydro-3-hydroxyanthranilate isomerase